MKLILKKGIFIGFVANLVIVLLFGWIANQRIKSNIELQKPDVGKTEVAEHLHGIVSQINAFGNGAKGYAIARNEKYLELLNQENINRHISSLRRLFSGNLPMTTKIDKLEALVDKRIQLDFRLITEIKKEKNEAEVEKLAEEDWQETQEIDKLVVQIEEETGVIYDNMKVALQKKEDRYRQAFAIVFSISMILLVAVFFIIRYNLRGRRESELRLYENKQLLQSVIDNMSSAVFVKQINGEYLMANKRFEQMFDPLGDSVKGKTDKEIFSEKFAEHFRESDLDVVKAGTEMKFEEVISLNGNQYTYEVKKFPLTDPEGKVYAVVGIARDISVDKTEDEFLKESQSQFQTLFNKAPDAIIVIDAESRVVKWNPKAEELFKWTEKEVIGQAMPEMIMPERYREKHYMGMKRYLSTGKGPILNSTIEIFAMDKDNREFDIELTVSPALLNGKHLFIAFIRDITKKKLMEKDTVRTHSFLESIIENIPDMIFVKDAKELRFVRFNRAGEQLLGYSKTELIGKNDYDFFPKQEADFFTEKDREVIKSGSMVDIKEEEIDTKSGKKWLHTKKIPIMDEQGKATYLLGISEDITERKTLENERRAVELKLRENEAKLRLILENIGEGVVVADTNQKVILFNQVASEIFETRQLSSIDWSDTYNIYYPDGLTVFPAQDLPLEKALKGGSTNETELILQNSSTGKKKLIKVTGHPIWGDKSRIIGAVATIRDITKFRQLEKALAESESKYRNLIGFQLGAKKGNDKGEDNKKTDQSE